MNGNHEDLPVPRFPRDAIIGIFLAAALACCTAAPATAAEDLYRAQTVVTGQGEANRMIGFASCMEDALIAERLAGDRRLAAYKAKAKDFGIGVGGEA